VHLFTIVYNCGLPVVLLKRRLIDTCSSSFCSFLAPSLCIVPFVVCGFVLLTSCCIIPVGLLVYCFTVFVYLIVGCYAVAKLEGQRRSGK